MLALDCGRNPPWLKSVAHGNGKVGSFGAKRLHVTCPGAEWDEGREGEVVVDIQDVHWMIGLVNKLDNITLFKERLHLLIFQVRYQIDRFLHVLAMLFLNTIHLKAIHGKLNGP